MAKLIFMGEKFAGRVYEFAVEKTSVGRGDHNTLTIQDASVSHSHGEILVYGTEVIVRDLGSSNGTLVNGERIQAQQQRPLTDGQIVKFGAVEARLEIVSDADSDTVTGWTAVQSHARYLGAKNESKPATAVAAKHEGSTTLVKDDHTLILTEPPAVATRDPLALQAAGVKVEKPKRTVGMAVLIAAIVLGAAALCWVILAKWL